MVIKYIVFIAVLFVSVNSQCPDLFSEAYGLIAGQNYGFLIYNNDTDYLEFTNETILYTGFAYNGTMGPCTPANMTMYNVTAGNNTFTQTWTNYDLINIIVNSTLFVSSSNQIPEGWRCVVVQACNMSTDCCSNTTIYLYVDDVPSCKALHTAKVGINSLLVTNMSNYIFDPSGYLYNITVINPPLYGNYSVDGIVFDYSPYSPFVSDDSMNYTACDNDGQCVECNLLIDILVAPNCTGDTISLLYPNVGSINVYSNDFDADNRINASLAFFNLTVNPSVTSFGNFTSSQNGLVFYTPIGNYTLMDYANYTVCDSDDGLCSVCSLTVSETSPMFCNSDSYMEYYLQSDLLNVLANDYNYQYAMNTWNLTLLTTPTLGTAQIVNGSILYQATHPNGTDIFWYSVYAPSGQYSNCSVTVIVRAFPVCGTHNYTFIDRNAPYIMNVTTTDYSPSNSSLVTLLYSNKTAIGNSIQTDGNPVYGIELIPYPGFVGYDTIIYEICDTSNLCSNCSISFELISNDTCKNDTYTIMQGTSGLFNILANDIYTNFSSSDINITVSALDQPLVANLTLYTNGSVRLDTASNFTGTLKFNYTISDSFSMSTCQVTFTILAMIVTTAIPTTAIPTTAIPTTAVSTTHIPTTAIPTTAIPTTAIPTTAIATTALLTTGGVIGPASTVTGGPFTTISLNLLNQIHIGEDSLGSTFTGMALFVLFSCAMVLTFITRRFTSPLTQSTRESLGIRPTNYDTV